MLRLTKDILLSQEYVENIFVAVTSSALKCPPILCELFHELRDIAISRFPGIFV